jgi:hypothetical protein
MIPGPITAYVVAISMLLFCGLSALALIYTVRHLDLPEADSLLEYLHDEGAAPSAGYRSDSAA